MKKRDLIYHRLGQFYFKICLYPWLAAGHFSLKMEFKIIHRLFNNTYNIILFCIYLQRALT